MKKTLISSLTALTLLAAGPALAHDAHPPGTDPGFGHGGDTGSPANPGQGRIHVSLDGFNCVEGDMLDADGKVVAPTMSAKNQFHTGYHLGYDAVLNAWHSMDADAANLENFIVEALKIVSMQQMNGLAGLDPKEDLDVALGCRFVSMIDGAANAVGDVVAETILNCGADGDYFGTFAAGMYCEFSKLADGLTISGTLDHQEGICAAAFEGACQASFDLEAQAYEYSDGTACAMYFDTEDEMPVYREKRHNFCIYAEAHGAEDGH